MIQTLPRASTKHSESTKRFGLYRPSRIDKLYYTEYGVCSGGFRVLASAVHCEVYLDTRAGAIRRKNKLLKIYSDDIEIYEFTDEDFELMTFLRLRGCTE